MLTLWCVSASPATTRTSSRHRVYRSRIWPSMMAPFRRNRLSTSGSRSWRISKSNILQRNVNTVCTIVPLRNSALRSRSIDSQSVSFVVYSRLCHLYQAYIFILFIFITQSVADILQYILVRVNWLIDLWAK